MSGPTNWGRNFKKVGFCERRKSELPEKNCLSDQNREPTPTLIRTYVLWSRQRVSIIRGGVNALVTSPSYPKFPVSKLRNTVFVFFERKRVLNNVFNTLHASPEKDSKFINHEFTENVARSLSRSLTWCPGQSIFQLSQWYSSSMIYL